MIIEEKENFKYNTKYKNINKLCAHIKIYAKPLLLQNLKSSFTFVRCRFWRNYMQKSTLHHLTYCLTSRHRHYTTISRLTVYAHTRSIGTFVTNTVDKSVTNQVVPLRFPSSSFLFDLVVRTWAFAYYTNYYNAHRLNCTHHFYNIVHNVLYIYILCYIFNLLFIHLYIIIET